MHVMHFHHKNYRQRRAELSEAQERAYAGVLADRDRVLAAAMQAEKEDQDWRELEDETCDMELVQMVKDRIQELRRRTE